eukprot:3085360-Amphidinium_carterae.1
MPCQLLLAELAAEHGRLEQRVSYLTAQLNAARLDKTDSPELHMQAKFGAKSNPHDCLWNGVSAMWQGLATTQPWLWRRACCDSINREVCQHHHAFIDTAQYCCRANHFDTAPPQTPQSN